MLCRSPATSPLPGSPTQQRVHHDSTPPSEEGYASMPSFSWQLPPVHPSTSTGLPAGERQTQITYNSSLAAQACALHILQSMHQDNSRWVLIVCIELRSNLSTTNAIGHF